jgi:hypothetical protein
LVRAVGWREVERSKILGRNTTRRDADKKKGKERSVVRDVLIDRERKREREREREGITSLRV